MLFEEKDEQFWLSIGKSLSGRFIFADSGSTETSEIHSLDLKAIYGSESASLKVIQPRRFGLRYDVSALQNTPTRLETLGPISPDFKR